LQNIPYFNLYESANYWLIIQSFVAGAGAEVQPLFSRRSRNFTQQAHNRFWCFSLNN
jgi:hypothetical protein